MFFLLAYRVEIYAKSFLKPCPGVLISSAEIFAYLKAACQKHFRRI